MKGLKFFNHIIINGSSKQYNSKKKEKYVLKISIRQKQPTSTMASYKCRAVFYLGERHSISALSSYGV